MWPLPRTPPATSSKSTERIAPIPVCDGDDLECHVRQHASARLNVDADLETWFAGTPAPAPRANRGRVALVLAMSLTLGQYQPRDRRSRLADPLHQGG